MYQAIICKIGHVRPIEKADKIQLATVVGHQVIVGVDIKPGDVGIFFPPDGQLSEEYAKANKLLKEDGGYLDSKRRIRALKLRGERSEGLWMPLTSLAFGRDTWDPWTVKVGDMLTEFNGKPVCNKYETPRTKSQGQSKSKTHQKQNMYFKKHYDTQQWRFFKDTIPDNAYISITEKLHGTSGRYGRVLTQPDSKWWQKLLGIKPTPVYAYLNGTRNVILDKNKLDSGTSFYGNEGFRFKAVQGIELYEGEILYYELVGSYSAGAGGDNRYLHLIMPAQPVKDKELVKRYGETMRYTYGTTDGQCDMYVYRITRTSPEGVVTELSWNQVKQRCNELGVAYVPELTSYINDTPNELDESVDFWTEGPSTLDPSHIREGVVIRVESDKGTNWYKNKSFDFGVLEGFIKDDESYVDVEESS